MDEGKNAAPARGKAETPVLRQNVAVHLRTTQNHCHYVCCPDISLPNHSAISMICFAYTTSCVLQ